MPIKDEVLAKCSFDVKDGTKDEVLGRHMGGR